MIEIKPGIAYEGRCPRCEGLLEAQRLLWQGIHVCVISVCNGCGAEIVSDLSVGQALFTPYRVDLEQGLLFGDPEAHKWFGKPLLNSLLRPNRDVEIGFSVEKFSTQSEVIILNCIDHLYGHALLKLLNAEAHLTQTPQLGLIVIVPRFLRWMVPMGVAEIWTVDLPLSKAQEYFPRLNERIQAETARFDRIWLSPAHSHPDTFDITSFTGVPKHDFSETNYRITFIWREDRPWLKSRLALRVARRTGLLGLLILLQNRKVCRLFTSLRKQFPDARFTVAGMGKTTQFPSWIDDHRVDTFTEVTEKQLCTIYSESRLVVGVHGSSMLLPSAHAGMTIDIMPMDRWCNLAQDVLYQEPDSRMSSYRYRYITLGTPVAEIAHMAGSQLACYETFAMQMRPGLQLCSQKSRV